MPWQMRRTYELHHPVRAGPQFLETQHYSHPQRPSVMGQAMVAIVEDDCTGCDLCIMHCPFEALLPLQLNPPGRKHAKRPVVVLEQRCVGCLSCIGSCPTDALHEVGVPPNASISPLVFHSEGPETETVVRWKKRSTRWP